MPGYSDDAWKDKKPFVTSGPRVPAIIVSPLVAPGGATNLRFDHTSFLQLLSDVAEPGHAYSEIVEKRRQEGALQRISEVLADGPVQEKPPSMPLFKLARPGNAAPPRVVNRSMQAFENLRQVLAAPRKDAIDALSKAAGSKIRLGSRNYIAARNIGEGRSS
jgi:phospholipase C